MSLLAPEGPVYQAGTLSGNPLVMAAGVAMLDAIADGKVYDRAEQLAGHLENGLRAAIKRSEAPASVTRIGSMLTLFFRPTPPRDYAEARESDTALFARFHGAMLARGVMLPPSQFETWFVSAAHTESEIDATVRAAHEALRDAMGLPTHRNGPDDHPSPRHTRQPHGHLATELVADRLRAAHPGIEVELR